MSLVLVEVISLVFLIFDDNFFTFLFVSLNSRLDQNFRGNLSINFLQSFSVFRSFLGYCRLLRRHFIHLNRNRPLTFTTCVNWVEVLAFRESLNLLRFSTGDTEAIMQSIWPTPLSNSRCRWRLFQWITSLNPVFYYTVKLAHILVLSN